MKKFTIATLRTKDMSIPSADGTNITFKSARLDKLFKDVHPNICVDVAVFSNTFNITVWIARTGIYFRSKYSREFDNSLGILLYSIHKMLQAAIRTSDLMDFLKELSTPVKAELPESEEELESENADSVEN